MTRSVIELATTAAQIQRPREALTAIAELRTRLEELEELHVEDLTRQGIPWSAIAKALGVSRQAIHKKYARRLTAGRPASRTSTTRGMLITAEARRCVFHARREAAALGETEVGGAHLLLGLLRENETPAAEALRSVGVIRDDLRAASRRRRTVRGRPRKVPPAEQLPISDAGRQAFEQALREAVRLGQAQLASEHLLLALLRRDGDAGKALLKLGIAAKTVEERLLEVLDERRTKQLSARGRNVRPRA